MQSMVIFLLHSLNGSQIRKEINESYYCKSETSMKTEYDEIDLHYWKLPKENSILKMKKDDGVDDDCEKKNNLHAHLGAFILSSSKRLLKVSFGEIDAFYKIKIYYSDTDSLYIEKKNWGVLDKYNLAGEELCLGKKDNKGGSVFYGLFLAPKLKKLFKYG